MSDDPARALALLAESTSPFLIGVRHHSPAFAAAMPELLDQYSPNIVLVELPADLQPWIEWLGHPDLETPVALAAVKKDGTNLGFYPFADFSPELAAIRWARAKNIPVECFDLPSSDILRDRDRDRGERREAPEVMEGLYRRFDAPNFEELWDRSIESKALGADPERVRRAGLALGWVLRFEAAARGGASLRDRLREQYMRRVLADKRERAAVVAGAFHAPALLDPPLLWSAPKEKAARAREVVSSLIPYAFELFDSRSGYPAGIRDPAWRQQVFEALRKKKKAEDVVSSMIVRVCRDVRKQGHVASVADARAAVNMARDLAGLRDLPGAGRREALEAIESTLARGELLGRGRVLAGALEKVFVGKKRGKLAEGTPRSGLAVHVEQLLASLRLPREEDDGEVVLHLDPLRSRLDRRRHVALMRLSACGVPYGLLEEGVAAGGVETLTKTWSVSFEPQTSAMIELAGMRGVTLKQAAAGAILARERKLERQEKLRPIERLALLELAAESGLAEQVVDRLRAMQETFTAEAGLAELIALVSLIEKIKRGHIPGLPHPEAEVNVPGEIEPFTWPAELTTQALLAAAIRALDGLGGSERAEDARALLELVRMFEGQSELGEGRLGWAIDHLADRGSPMMQGAASALRVSMQRASAESFGERLASWIDAAVDADQRRALSQRLRGALIAASPLFESDPRIAQAMIARVRALSDREFLARLPAIREGFEVLSPAARARLLAVLGERTSEGAGEFEVDPRELESFAEADRRGKEAVQAWRAMME